MCSYEFLLDTTIAGIILAMAIVVSIVLFQIWLPDREPSLDLHSLKTKPVNAIIARFVSQHEECFTADEAFLSRYPELNEGIKLADEESNGTTYGDRYAGHGFNLSKDSALRMITELPFNHSVTKHHSNYFTKKGIDILTDETHTFQCIIKHDGNYYYLTIEFVGFSLAPDEGLTVIKITKEEGSLGKVLLKPQNATVWLTFNNTVVWKNELKSEITLVSYGNSPVNRFDEFATITNTIKPDGIWYFRFIPDWGKYAGEDQIYRYHVEPYGLQGVIHLKMYPRCMNEATVKSLYSQTKLYVKFPAYLPEGYGYQCGIHILSSAVELTYWNNHSEEINFLYSQGLGKGAIQISVMKELQEWDEEKVAQQQYSHLEASGALEAIFTRVNGSPAVGYMVFQSFEGKVESLHILHLYLDQETYILKGIVPMEELIKIAESMR